MPLDDTFTELFGESADADDAEITQTADDDEQGAPESSDALMALLSPEDDAQDDADDEAEGADEDEAPDYQALFEQSQSEIAQERQRLQIEQDALLQERQLQELRKANDAWRAEEEQVIAESFKSKDYSEAAGKLVTYYRGKLDAQAKAAQMLIQGMMAPQYADSVAKQAGLTDEDAALLRAVDPKFAPALAQAIAQKNANLQTQLSSMQDELKQLKRGRQSQRRAMTGADRLSSPRGSAPAKRDFVDGSTDHITAILRATQALKGRT